MCGVAGQQHASGAVLRRLPAGVGKPRHPSRPADGQVLAVHPADAGAQFAERHRGVPVQAVRVGLGGDHAVEPRAEGNEGNPHIGQIGGRHACFQRDVAEAQQEGRRDAGELDPGLLADHAGAAVTAGHVPGSQLAVSLWAIELDIHAFSVLVHSGELVTAPDRDAELTRILVQDFLGGRLLDEQSAQAEVADLLQVQRDQGEVRGVRHRGGGAGMEAAEQAAVVEGVHRSPDERKRLG
jgi:hypothetical protein